MKGSPIISTILACIIMLGIYLCMQTFLRSDVQIVESKNSVNTKKHPSAAVYILHYIEIQTSTPPSSILITHPITGEELLKITDLTETEWTGEIDIPLTDEENQIEFNVSAQWDKTPEGTQNFIYIQLSSRLSSDTSTVLRGPQDIDTTATFKF